MGSLKENLSIMCSRWVGSGRILIEFSKRRLFNPTRTMEYENKMASTARFTCQTVSPSTIAHKKVAAATRVSNSKIRLRRSRTRLSLDPIRLLAVGVTIQRPDEPALGGAIDCKPLLNC